MKFKKILTFAVAVTWGASALAGSVAGTGGSSEVTQLMNNMELVTQNAKIVEGYVRQGLQYDTQLRNLIKNPASMFGPEAGALMRSVGALMDSGQAIGSSMYEVDRRLGQRYTNTQAMSFADRFRSWTNGSKGNLEASMRAAGMRRDQYKSDAAALDALYAKAQNDQGAAAAAQTAAEINIQNVRQMQALGDMLAEQHAVTAEYRLAALDKEQAAMDKHALLAAPYNPQIPPIEKADPIKWGHILFKK